MPCPSVKVFCLILNAPNEDSDQSGHLPSLIRVFPVHSMGSYTMFLHADSEDWADAQADLSLHWVHMSVCWLCHEVAHIKKGHLCKFFTFRAFKVIQMATIRIMDP